MKKVAKKKSATHKPPGRPGRPTRSDAESTVQKVVEVATRLFAEKGYEGTSTKEICRDAGVNVAAIHYHFKSKENLYRAVVERFGDSSIDAAARALQPANSIDEFKTRLTIYFAETVEALSRRPEIAMMIVRDAQTHPELIHEVTTRSFGHLDTALNNFLKHARDAGYINRHHSLEACTMSLQSQLIYLIVTHRAMKLKYGFELSNPEHRSNWVTTTIDLYFNGVKAQ